ncbi:MAG: capsular biosynthesis protein [Pseudomonadota bacterium]
MTAVAAAVGPITLLRWAPMSFQGFDETSRAAEAALSGAIRQPKTRTVAWAKRRLYALQYNGARRYFAARPGAVAACWNGLNGTRFAFMEGARDAGAARLFFELAPLPGSLTVDPCGVNDANALPRDSAPYRRWWTGAGAPPPVKPGFRQRPRRQGAAAPTAPPPADEDFLFAPLQLANDSQLRLFGGAFRSVPSFVDALGQAAAALPDKWHLRVKEHPSSTESLAARIRAAAPGKLYLDNETDTFALVEAAAAVVTVNSSVGLQAMFYGKPVLVAGDCFWSLPGIATPTRDPEALTAAFSSPDALSFDPESRAAFLAYLTTTYYIKVSSVAGGAVQLIDGEDRKILARLDPSWPGLD